MMPAKTSLQDLLLFLKIVWRFTNLQISDSLNLKIYELLWRSVNFSSDRKDLYKNFLGVYEEIFKILVIFTSGFGRLTKFWKPSWFFCNVNIIAIAKVYHKRFFAVNKRRLQGMHFVGIWLLLTKITTAIILEPSTRSCPPYNS